MTKSEVMKKLKANGSEQARMTYRRHGFEGQIKVIEGSVHESPNWVRYAMNNALINPRRSPRRSRSANASRG